MVSGPLRASRLPSLSGIRGLSIAFVLVGHLAGTPGFIIRHATVPTDALAHLGVQIFFVLSGFLITTLLREEQMKTGAVSLRRFYWRRAFRITPAFAVYVAVIAGLGAFHLVRLTRADVLRAAFYTANFGRLESWQLGHLWSLSVEEQFYLALPLAIRVLGWGRAIRSAALFALAVPIVRSVVKIRLGYTPWWAPGDADAIAVGCLLAAVHDRLANAEWHEKFLRSRLTLVALAPPILSVIINDRAIAYPFVVLSNPCIAVLIHRAIRLPLNGAGRLFNWAPLDRLGLLSYSLYLWQQPFLNRSGQTLLQHFPLNVIAALAAAGCSYHLVEKPFLSLRERFARSFEPTARARFAPAPQRVQTAP